MAGHAPDPLVIGVEDGPAVGRQRLDQLTLAGLDGLDGAGPGEVHAAHGGDDADGGAGQARQQGDLAGRVEAHLEHRGLVLGPQAQQRHGQADLVVPVGRVAQDREALLEDLRDLLLGRGLGQRAGDAHDQRVEAIAVGGRDRAQGRGRVGDADDAHAPARGERVEALGRPAPR